MKRYKVAFLLLVLILASCSSPKQDGENQAQEECEIWDTYVQNTVMAYTNFVKEFGSKNYKTRAEARKELNSRINEVESNLHAQLDELDKKHQALLEKYGENNDEIEELSRAYDEIKGAYSLDTTKFAGLRKQAYDKILTIIPPDPSRDKLQKDLIGRQIRSLPGGYLSDQWSWTIEQGEIKDLQINEVQNIDAHNKEYSVDMTLQASGAAYKVKGKVFYVLADRDDWEIDMLEPSEVEIVKTGRYDNSIEAVLYRMIMGEQLSIHNNSDAALLVGFSLIDTYGKSSKHSLMVPGGMEKTYTDFGIAEYSIDFVERP